MSSQEVFNEAFSMPPDEAFEPFEGNVTFQQLEAFLHVFIGPDGDRRKHFPLSPQLVTLALQNNPELFEERKSIYKKLAAGWEELKIIDSPFTQEGKEARMKNGIDAIEARKRAKTPKEIQESEQVIKRLHIIDQLGEDPEMAAHSERVAYHVGMFYALYIAHMHDERFREIDPTDIARLSTFVTKEALERHIFTIGEVKIIAEAILDAQRHDEGKKTKYNGQYIHQDTLYSTGERTFKQKMRMNRHTSEGALWHLRTGTPLSSLLVALNHHTTTLRRGRAKIDDDPSAKYRITVTSIYDQLEAAMSIRNYKWGVQISHLRNDSKIRKQLKRFGDTLASVIYLASVNILEQELGSNFNQFPEEESITSA